MYNILHYIVLYNITHTTISYNVNAQCNAQVRQPLRQPVSGWWVVCSIAALTGLTLDVAARTEIGGCTLAKACRILLLRRTSQRL